MMKNDEKYIEIEKYLERTFPMCYFAELINRDEDKHG